MNNVIVVAVKFCLKLLKPYLKLGYMRYVRSNRVDTVVLWLSTIIQIIVSLVGILSHFDYAL